MRRSPHGQVTEGQARRKYFADGENTMHGAHGKNADRSPCTPFRYPMRAPADAGEAAAFRNARSDGNYLPDARFRY